MATYAETVIRVRDWANRDDTVLPDMKIDIFLQFAADEAYRLLRIPALECLTQYTIDIDEDEEIKDRLAIPTNLTEFIQFRKKTDESNSGYIPFQAKSDVQSFFNEYTVKYDHYFWTRDRGDIVLYPEYVDGEEYELYFYGRQDALDAREDDAPDTNTPNWLRDENEKIILFGALAEAFDYLDEPEQAGKYREKFYKEIQALNTEETMRKSRGGNVQIHYNAPLI